jgi:hypothetical protein
MATRTVPGRHDRCVDPRWSGAAGAAAQDSRVDNGQCSDPATERRNTWRTAVRLCTVAAVTAALAAVPVRVSAAPAGRIMVVGDSISQGHEGDFTWRYRLAQHLGNVGAAADFVGPWTGTNVLPAAYPPGWPDTSSPPVHNGAYRPGISFDNDNLTQWVGRSIRQRA